MRILNYFFFFTLALLLVSCLESESSKVFDLTYELKEKTKVIKNMDIQLNDLQEEKKQLVELNNQNSSSIFNFFTGSNNKNYLLLGIHDWRKSENNIVNADPLLIVENGQLLRPGSKAKKYLSSHKNLFGIFFGNHPIGVLKQTSEYRSDGISMEFLHTCPKIQSSPPHWTKSYLALASSNLSTLHSKSSRRVPSFEEERKFRLKALSIIEKEYSLTVELDSLEIADINLVKPNGHSDSLFIGTFIYKKGYTDYSETYITFICSYFNLEKDPIMVKTGFSKSNNYKGTKHYVYLDLIDYNFDGVDEFLFVEQGYEHRDVILFELRDSTFVEIYRIATSPT